MAQQNGGVVNDNNLQEQVERQVQDEDERQAYRI
jgi:hypothetical protein